MVVGKGGFSLDTAKGSLGCGVIAVGFGGIVGGRSEEGTIIGVQGAEEAGVSTPRGKAARRTLAPEADDSPSIRGNIRPWLSNAPTMPGPPTWTLVFLNPADSLRHFSQFPSAQHLGTSRCPRIIISQSLGLVVREPGRHLGT